MEAITNLLEDGTATVEPLSPGDRGRLAAHLLQAAGSGNARVVRTVSVKGGGRAFQVPAAVAYAAGLVPDTADADAATKSTESSDTGPRNAQLSPNADEFTKAVLDTKSENSEPEPPSATAAEADPQPAPAKETAAKKAAPAKKTAPRTAAKKESGDVE
ncbi:hypothetical protein [Nocardia sp. NPDC005745]|uniref:hypothetical protein n=1 Tax=Nocardia sp. NPDC005745 TaxID=3157061 RepID=UPI0033C23AF1